MIDCIRQLHSPLHSPATPKISTIQTLLRVALTGLPAKLVRLCRSVAAMMRLRGLACMKTGLRRHNKEVVAGHEKHCRYAQTWASTTVRCHLTVICACLSHGSAIVLHDLSRCRSVCLTRTHCTDLTFRHCHYRCIFWDWHPLHARYIYIRPCVDHEEHNTITTMACRPCCRPE